MFPNKLKFRYRLKDSDRWSPYSDKTSLYLSYLPSGKYNIELQIYDVNAGKTSTFNLIKIEIKQPFWMTWWFFIATFLFLFGSLFLLFIRYKNNNKEKAIIQKRIEETKLEALLSQMNPHFTFNAMNAIQDFILKKDIDNSLRYIGNFAKLMRKTLENSSKPTISLEEELDYLKLYISIENMRFDNRIAIEFKIASDLDIYIHRIPTMLLQPFVENVFVHAFDDSYTAPKLLISFEMMDQQTLECKICDNVKGFVAATTPKKTNRKRFNWPRND